MVTPRLISFRVTKSVTPDQTKKKPSTGGNLGNILNSLKKKKISTLHKSKLDWDNYKEETGIQDELDQHVNSKDR